MVTVLIPSYREGVLLNSAIRSVLVPGVDHVALFEGPLNGAEPSSDSHLPIIAGGTLPGMITYHAELGEWEDDAAKRSYMLDYAKRRHEELYPEAPEEVPLWLLWLDGDEALIFGEYLLDWINRAEKETGAGGFPIRFVELDGSVARSYNKVVNGHAIRRYVHSINTVELTSPPMVISLPHEKICHAGGVPVWDEEKEGRPIEVDDLALLRPPVAGEPHLLHRSVLRDPGRVAMRQSDAEREFYEDAKP